MQGVTNRNSLLDGLCDRLRHDLRGEVVVPFWQAHLDVPDAPSIQLRRSAGAGPAPAKRPGELHVEQVFFLELVETDFFSDDGGRPAKLAMRPGRR
jgi:hypothetical protein